jgi:hypothetical protein
MTVINVAFWLVALGGASLLAWRNLRANRADRRGAARLAIGLVLLTMVSWLFGSHHVSSADVELRQFLVGTSFATFLGATVWVLYLAIEPHVRRFWPDGLLGWTRLLSGRLHDPRVGRDILIGLVFGAALMVIETAQGLLPQQLGRTAPLPPFSGNVMPLAAASFVVPRWVNILYSSLQSVLLVVMIFVVLRLVLRRGWLAAVVGVIILTILSDNGQAYTGTWFDFVSITLVFVIVTFGLFRFGLLAMTVASFADNVATGLPLTLRLSAWWATPSMFTLALLIGLAAFGFYAARAGQPVFGNMAHG